MACSVVAKTPHFVLHQWSEVKAEKAATGPGFVKAPALFVEGVLLLGALTPKRWAKRAVTRNLIKRQIFNVTQTMAHHLERSGFSVRQFPSASSDALKTAVRMELMQLLTGLSKP
ncbi:MAG: hypothetical protein RIR68_3159 [Pseudomonadota bacterium]